jgi:hypothetical protein
MRGRDLPRRVLLRREQRARLQLASGMRIGALLRLPESTTRSGLRLRAARGRGVRHLRLTAKSASAIRHQLARPLTGRGRASFRRSDGVCSQNGLFREGLGAPPRGRWPRGPSCQNAFARFSPRIVKTTGQQRSSAAGGHPDAPQRTLAFTEQLGVDHGFWATMITRGDVAPKKTPGYAGCPVASVTRKPMSWSIFPSSCRE